MTYATRLGLGAAGGDAAEHDIYGNPYAMQITVGCGVGMKDCGGVAGPSATKCSWCLPQHNGIVILEKCLSPQSWFCLVCVYVCMHACALRSVLLCVVHGLTDRVCLGSAAG